MLLIIQYQNQIEILAPKDKKNLSPKVFIFAGVAVVTATTSFAVTKMISRTQPQPSESFSNPMIGESENNNDNKNITKLSKPEIKDLPAKKTKPHYKSHTGY